MKNLKNNLNIITVGAIGLGFLSGNAIAYPLLSSGVGSADGKVLIYQDHANSGSYWYLPTAVTAAPNPDGNYSYPVVRPNYFSFSFLGQISAAEQALQNFASQHGMNRDDIAPVPYDTTANTACQNVDEDSGVQVLYPKSIGGYGEYVPVTVYTKNPDMVPIMEEKIEKAGGINCTVDVTFKAVIDAYSITYDVDMNTLYDRFEASVHAGGWFWDVELHTMIEHLYESGAIHMYKLEDKSEILPSDTSDKAKASFDAVTDQVFTLMFQRLNKIPDGPMPAGGGGVYSFRADYRRSTSSFIYHGEYHAQSVVSKASVITINVAKGGK